MSTITEWGECSNLNPDLIFAAYPVMDPGSARANPSNRPLPPPPQKAAVPSLPPRVSCVLLSLCSFLSKLQNKVLDSCKQFFVNSRIALNLGLQQLQRRPRIWCRQHKNLRLKIPVSHMAVVVWQIRWRLPSSNVSTVVSMPCVSGFLPVTSFLCVFLACIPL